MNVIKRDGKIEPFNIVKIIKAMESAFVEVDGKLTGESLGKIHSIASDIEKIDKSKDLQVEEIQDIIEKKLMATNRKDVAKAYIRFRYMRELRRLTVTNLDYEIFGLKDGTNEETRNNANKDGRKLQTLKPMIADVTIIDQAKRLFFPEKIMREHGKKMYVHDMNYAGLPIFNCINVNWENTLEYGAILGNAPITDSKSYEVAIALISQISSHVSSNCYGGVTFPNLTRGLAKYAKKSLEKYRQDAEKWVENKDKREPYAWEHLKQEIKDGCQSLEYEIQTLMNSRGESPFLTIEVNTVDENADEETQKIQEMVCEGFLNQRIRGLDGRTPEFPKMVFEVRRGNNLEKTDPYYHLFQLAIKCSSLRCYPDYLMYDKVVEVTGSYKPPMSCRSFLQPIKNDKGEYVPYGFNQGVVSVNLVRHAIMANGDENKFYELLKDTLDNYVIPIHMIRHNQLKTVRVEQAPILYMYGIVDRLQSHETIEKLLYKDRSSISIGYVGVHNALKALYGKSFDEDRTMIKKGKKMIQFLSNYCDKLKEETNIGFSLYSTPAETLATKFCKQDIKDFGIIEGVNDQGYYENSFHYPSNEDINAFDKIDIESQMSYIPRGGAIQYCELGDITKNTKAIEDIVRYAYDKCHYFGVNVAADKCFKCGYVGMMKTIGTKNEDFECPQCGNKDPMFMSIIRRLCGYFSDLAQRKSVDNKMKEIAHRHNNSTKGCCE